MRQRARRVNLARMRILALTPRLPFPPIGGDKLRAYAFLWRLAERHDVTLLSFVERDEEREQAAELARRHPRIQVDTVTLGPWRSRLGALRGLASRLPLQVHYYRSAAMRRLVAERLSEQRFDAVYVHLLRMAQYVADLSGVPRVLDMTDAISMVFARAQSVRRDWFTPVNAIERARLTRYEPELARAFERLVLISEVDRAHLVANGALAERIAIVNNGVDLEYFAPRATSYDPKRLVFVGNLHSFANTDAALFILGEIFPLLRAQEPGALVDIVGVHPPASVRAFDGTPGVTVTGAVDDVRPYVERAAVSLCPVRVAGGVQNKILESLALGVPVVTSPEGFEGLGARSNGEDGVRVARSAAEFAALALELMRDPALRAELARRGREFIARSYDWDRQVTALEQLLQGGARG
jgi:sugar transferase (PEP-CTERM/EpsH1 system associated)